MRQLSLMIKRSLHWVEADQFLRSRCWGQMMAGFAGYNLKKHVSQHGDS